MPLANNFARHQMPFELAHHFRCAVTAHADKPDASPGKTFDSGNADIRGEALRDDLTLIERHEEDPAHLLGVRLAAATASLRLL